MKLDEYLKLLPKSCMVSIGAHTAYLFIGTVKEFYEDVEKLDEANVLKGGRTLHGLETSIKNLRERKVTNRTLLAVLNNEVLPHCAKKHPGDMAYKEALKDVTERLKTIAEDDLADRKIGFYEKSAKETMAYITEYKPLLYREVKDQYRRVDGSRVCLVEGPENGAYWVRSEYANGVEEEKEDGEE